MKKIIAGMIAIMLVTGLSAHASDKKPAKKAKAKKETKDCKDKKCCKPTPDCPVVCLPSSCNK